MQLILFDIDGTLVDSGGAGVRALDYAFKEVLSIENAFRDVSMAGKTDLQIVKEGLSMHGLPSDNGFVSQIIDSYIRHLSVEINHGDKHLKPGIVEALRALKAHNGRYQIGLLTGNLEQGARIKLGAFGLNEYFATGAFGSDHEDRNKLLPIAVERFKIITGREFDFTDCVIIGDTPRDVMCARPYNAICIAVATGPYGARSLVAAGADVVVEDLSDTDHFLNILYFLEK
ncbi:MAG: HAD family hydrolase [Dissulfurispiraceae bacterium]|jgi:phosphoglycolate phosphatase